MSRVQHSRGKLSPGQHHTAKRFRAEHYMGEISLWGLSLNNAKTRRFLKMNDFCNFFNKNVATLDSVTLDYALRQTLHGKLVRARHSARFAFQVDPSRDVCENLGYKNRGAKATNRSGEIFTTKSTWCF